jgi:hypothetical protein
MLTIFLPILYVAGLLVVLTTVVKAIKGKSQVALLESSYFPLHREKLEYEELSEQYSPDDMNGKKVLAVALMKRAMESVSRVLRLREEKPPLKQMVRDGVIGEELWDKLVVAEQEIEHEMSDVSLN